MICKKNICYIPMENEKLEIFLSKPHDLKQSTKRLFLLPRVLVYELCIRKMKLSGYKLNIAEYCWHCLNLSYYKSFHRVSDRKKNRI